MERMVCLGLFISSFLYAGYGLKPGSSKLWPNAIVPYVIEDSEHFQNKMIKTLDYITGVTGIRFKERGSESDYIVIARDAPIVESGGGLYSKGSSYVGKQGGRQVVHVDLFSSLFRELTLHEIGHALGLKHEHQRPDRDWHVQIDYAKLKDSRNYAIGDSSIYKMYGQYDTNSIMQYYEERGGVKLKSTGEYPYREDDIDDPATFSPGDIAALREMYGLEYTRPRVAEKVSPQPTSPPPSLPTIRSVPSPSSAQELVVGKSQYKLLTQVGEIDEFYFKVYRRGDYVVETIDSNPALPVRLTLTGGTSNVNEEAYFNGKALNNAKIEVRLDPGTYFVKASHFHKTSGSTGSYQIVFRED